MRKIHLYSIIIAFLVSPLCMIGQNTDDALRYSQSQLLGSARSLAMGNAFGALGGDFTSLSINPAGIATYRTSEFTFTPSLSLNNSKSNTDTEQKFNAGFNQIGFVVTSKASKGKESGLISSHFAIGYQRTDDFNQNFQFYGQDINFSMTDTYANIANQVGDPDGFDAATYVAYDTYLIDGPNEDGNFTNFLYEEDNVDPWEKSKNSGSTGNFIISSGVNISNKFQLGMTLGIAFLDYQKTSEYYEYYSDANFDLGDPMEGAFDEFTFNNKINTSGTGLDLKIGAIFKPIHALRFGIAFHTPTWYSIQERNSADVDVLFFNYDPAYSSDYTEFDYSYRTPLKTVFSFAGIIGKRAIVSLDYEYTDYATTHFSAKSSNRSENQLMSELNTTIENTFTQTHNFRLGGEIRVNSMLSLRAGYAIQQSPYQNEPKDNDIVNFSGGLGFKSGVFSADFAYMLSDYNQSYHPATDMNSKTHYAAITLGWKF